MKGDRIKINKILVVLTGFLLLLNILLADTEKEDSLLVEIPDIDIYDELAGDLPGCQSSIFTLLCISKL